MRAKQNGLTLEQGQPVKTLSKRTSDFIAACAKAKGAASVFGLRKMTAWQGGVLFVGQAALGFYSIALALQIWRAPQ